MGQNIIEVGYNIAEFKAQSQEMRAEMKLTYDAYIAISNTKIGPGSNGGIAELKAQIMALEKEIKNLQDANVAYAASQQRVTEETRKSTGATKEHNKAQTEFQQLQSKITAARKGDTAAVIAAKQQLVETNKEMKLNAALQTAVAGSINEHEAKVNALRFALKRVNLETDEGKKKADEIREAMNYHNRIIQQNLDLDGQRIKNIGNYNGQLGVLGKALRGLGGLGEIVGRAVGIDPTAVAGIRQAGIGLIDLKHALDIEKIARVGDSGAIIQNTALRDGNTTSIGIHTAATEVDTVAVEGQAVATTAAAEATGFFSKALNYLKANPVILWITGLAAAVGALTLLFKSNKTSLEDLTKAAKAYSDAVKTDAEVVSDLTTQQDEGLIAMKKSLESQLAFAVASHASQESQLAIKKQIAAVDKQISDDQLKAHPKINDELKEQEFLLTHALKVQKELLDHVKVKSRQDLVDIANGNVKKGISATIDQMEAKIVLKQLDAGEKVITAAKASITTLKKIKTDAADSDQKTIELSLEQAVMSADQKREVALHSAQLEFAAVQDKNNRILNNEKSTHEQRIAAIKSNAEAAKTVAAAELAGIDPTDTTGKAKGTLTYYAAVDKANKDSIALQEKENREFEKRQLAAKHEFLKSDLEESAKTNEAISKDQSVAVDERLAAYGKYFDDQSKIIQADRQFQIDTKVLTDEELLALDEQTKNKLLALAEKSKKDISDIIVQSAAEHLSLQQSEDKKLLAAKELALSGKKGMAGIKAAKEVEELEYKSNQKTINAAIDKDKAILASAKTTNEAKLAAQIDLNNQTAALYKLDADHANKEEEKKAARKKELHDLEIQLANKTIEAIQSMVDNGYEKQKNAVQALIDLNNKFSEAETERINNSTLNEQDKAAKLIQLKAETEAKNTQYAREQKEIDIKKAKFDRDVAIAKIILNTALAVTNAISTGDPYTAALRAAIVGAIGAAELAIAVATPIPSYGEGSDDTPGGISRYAERGPEAVKVPGKPWKIVTKETIGYLPRHSKVVPLTGDVVDSAINGSMIANTAERLALMETMGNRKANNDWQKATDKIVGAIERNKSNTVVKNNIQIGADFHLWVNKYVNGNG